MSESLSSYIATEDTLKILVATDCHLGYSEDDPVIGDDSFVTFEEILILAVEKDVDMILLGGDLFHFNNPTQRSLNKCMSLLRQYTMGCKPVFLELLSDAPLTQPAGTAPVNYLDQNLNVSIPVFSIHGNHDDPSGAGHHSSLDTLSSAGLLNYFGKWTDLSKIQIRPILLKKGKTMLALYGLSHIKDERLSRLFLEEKVVLARPKETPDDWFNIFVLHQNRVDRGPKRFISDSYLPGFLDLVVWGHEHDCDIIPEKNLEKGFYVTQPGSSVPTSLSEGETKPKHVGLLEIRGKTFKLTPLKLKTTRPFVWDCIRLMDIPVSSQAREKKSEEIKAACMARVEEMIQEAQNFLTSHPKQPKLPLIRLRCDYNDETQLFNVIKFGQMYYQRVANPDNEVIRLKKISEGRDRQHLKVAKDDVGQLKELSEDVPEAFTSCVEAIAEDYFKTKTENRLLVLSVKGMASAVEKFLSKDYANAIDDICRHQEKETLKKLLTLDITEENIKEELERIRDEREANNQAEEEELRRMFQERFEERHQAGANTTNGGGTALASDSDDEMMSSAPIQPSGTSTQRRPATIPAMFGRASKTNASVNVPSDDDEPRPKSTRGRGRGSRGGRGASAKTRALTKTRVAPALNVSSLPRSTPPRKAALASQAIISSSIVYDDSDSN